MSIKAMNRFYILFYWTYSCKLDVVGGGKHSSKLNVAGSCFSSSFVCLLFLDLRPSGVTYWPEVMSPCCLHNQTVTCPKYKTKNTKRQAI